MIASRAMTRPTARSAAFAACAALALAPWCAVAPLAAQDRPGGFTLPDPTPTPSPAPAGPVDERAGVAIPPRAPDSPSPSPSPTARPVAPPSAGIPVDVVVLPPPVVAPPRAAAPSLRPAPSSSATAPAAALPETQPSEAPSPAASGAAPPLASAPAGAGETGTAPADASPQPSLPDWWPYAAGGLGALALLGAGALAWRRRKPRALRLAAPAEGAAEAAPSPAATPPRLDVTLEVIRATRSVMMFTLEYRITLANRSDRAVCDLALAVQIACARAGTGSGGNAASPGAAQALATIARIGPHQARSVTGEVQLPLSAVAPLRQGNRPLFVPLVHVTLDGTAEAGGGSVTARSFAIGTPSASGRIHPIPLDQPPGAIPGLVAQQVAVPPASAAA